MVKPRPEETIRELLSLRLSLTLSIITANVHAVADTFRYVHIANEAAIHMNSN